MIDFEKLQEGLKEALANLTEEDIQKYFPESNTPKGWVSIEDDLPKWYADDLEQGYTIYKVKDIHGNESEAYVCDHNVWYYEAKDAGITHWWNE